MLRSYLLLSLMLLFMVSCSPQDGDIPEPDYNPNLLKPGKYAATEGRKVNMGSLPKPEYVPVQSTYVKPGPWPYKTISAYDRTGGELPKIPAQIRKVDMDAFAKPEYIKTAGRKVPSRWPQWIPSNRAGRP